MITILASGSRGDTQPYLALGVALKKAGKQVRIAAFENYETFVKEHGLEFFPISGDIEKVVNSGSVTRSKSADNPLKIILGLRELQKMVFSVQEDLFAACQGSEAVIYHPGAAIGYFAAQQQGIPAIFAPPFPMTPTREYPSLIFYGRVPASRSLNLLTHKIFSRIMWSTSEKPIKAFWMKKFGQLPENFGNPFIKQVTRKYPTIISNSEYVFPTPADWPANVYCTGYWFLEESAAWVPPDELLRFFENGEPPVYVGFGSLASGSAEKLTKTVCEGLRLAGKRGIIAAGWGGLTNAHSSPEDFFIQSAPHSWLFKRVQAVVHHGGAGTTAAGLRAGVPSIIVPFSNDQFAWGKKVYDLGVGSEPIPAKWLTAKKLAAAISSATTKDTLARAKTLGEKINAEQGTQNAVRVILQALIE